MEINESWRLEKFGSIGSSRLDGGDVFFFLLSVSGSISRQTSMMAVETKPIGHAKKSSMGLNASLVFHSPTVRSKTFKIHSGELTLLAGKSTILMVIYQEKWGLSMGYVSFTGG